MAIPLPLLIGAASTLGPSLLQAIGGGGRQQTQPGADRAMTPTSTGLPSLGELGGIGLPGIGGAPGGNPLDLAKAAGGLIGDIGSFFGAGDGRVAKLKRQLLQSRARKDISDARKLLERKQDRAARAALFAATGISAVLNPRQARRARVGRGLVGAIASNQPGAATAAVQGAVESARIPGAVTREAIAAQSGANQLKQRQLALDTFAARGKTRGIPTARPSALAVSAGLAPATASFATFTRPSEVSPMAVGVRSPFRSIGGGFGDIIGTQTRVGGFQGVQDALSDLFLGVETPQTNGSAGTPQVCPELFNPPTTLSRSRPIPLVAAMDPNSGKLTYFRHVGRPVLFSGDLGIARRISKTAAKAQRGLPTRRSSTRRGRR